MTCKKGAVGITSITLLLLAAVELCQSAPVRRSTTNESPQRCASESCRKTDTRDLVEMGFEFLKDAYENIALEQVSQNDETVCALFDEYSRLSVTLENHRENDSLQTNLTLLVMIAEKLLIDSCEHNMTENINCSIGSISQYCLSSSMARKRREDAKTYLVGTSPRIGDEDYGCWMTQFFQSSSPDERVLETLVENLKVDGTNCTILEDGFDCQPIL